MKLLYFNTHLELISNVFTIYMLIGLIKGYPIVRKDILENSDLSDEKTYPNGTVVGKYIYKDNDGNPIHVKYYADDSGYGVELKSVKVMSSASDLVQLPEQTTSTYMLKTTTTIGDAAKTAGAIGDDAKTTGAIGDDAKTAGAIGKEASDKTISFEPIYDHRASSNPFEDLVKDSKSSKTKYKTSSDYEIFVDNELKAPKKCGQEKVHVYFDNTKRKARHTLNEFDALKYCEQMFS